MTHIIRLFTGCDRVMAASLLAVGIDPAKCILFRQSDVMNMQALDLHWPCPCPHTTKGSLLAHADTDEHSQVPEHAALGWVLGCCSSLSPLQQMTQFKEKKINNQKCVLNMLAALPPSTNSHRLRSGTRCPWGCYRTRCCRRPTSCSTKPNWCLTIALHISAKHHCTSHQCQAPLWLHQQVPVGEDQTQHLELCRSLARKFNSLVVRGARAWVRVCMCVCIGVCMGAWQPFVHAIAGCGGVCDTAPTHG